MQDVLQDLRYALRQFRSSPSFAAVAILSLALGIGATTAVFSVIHAVLMNPYPYAASDRMVHLVVRDNAGNPRWVTLTAAQFQEFRQAKSIESVAGEDEWNLTTTGGDLPEDVTAVYLTANAFNHFGVPTLLGRGLIPSDAPEGQAPQNVAVLGYDFWRRHFNGDPGIVGKSIQLSHQNYSIVGVTPSRFTWGDADVYLPYKFSMDAVRTIMPITRLKPGVSRAAANAEFQVLLGRFAKDTPKHFPEHFHVAIQGLNDQFIERIGGTLGALFAAVALLLIIGCGNVSILLLARGTGRQHEIAVRAAIGAARFRIVRQLLTESVILSFAGSILGIGLAYGLLRLIVKWLPLFSFPHEAAININLPVLLFSVGLALFTGILFGISPALRFSRPEIAQVMQSSTRKMTGSPQGKRLHSSLVAGQIALTLLLLVGAGTAMRNFVRLTHVELGYDPHHTMSVGIPVHDNTYTTWQARAEYFEQLRQKVAATPQVMSAGISTNATPPDNGWENKFEIMGRPVAQEQRARINFINLDYFAVLRIPLMQGRIFDQAETARGARLAVINQTMARQYFPNGDAIGSEVRMPDLKGEPPFQLSIPESTNWFQVIGVTADARDDGLRKPIKPALYVPYTVNMPVFTQILVRTQGEPLALLHSVRAQIHSVDPDQQSFRRVWSLEEWIRNQPEYAQEHLIATLFGMFSVLALVLAAAGLYSVLSYTVAQRTGEFGIRMALGAVREDVLKIVFRSAVAGVGSGIAAGLVIALLVSKLMSRWMEGSARDPFVLGGVTLLLIATSAFACFVPARRASSVDPMVALRYE
jgi:predicted permease